MMRHNIPSSNSSGDSLAMRVLALLSLPFFHNLIIVNYLSTPAGKKRVQEILREKNSDAIENLKQLFISVVHKHGLEDPKMAELPSGLNISQLVNLLTINSILANTAIMLQQLEKIEARLKLFLQKVFGEINTLPKDYLDRKLKGDQYKKLFFKFMTELARELGFAGAEQLFDAATDYTFFKPHLNMNIFEDTFTIGSTHGPWTHTLQLLCLALYQEDYPAAFGGEPVAKINQWIAKRDSDAHSHIWANLFETGFGFSNVIPFGKVLIDGTLDSVLPLLTQMLRRANTKTLRLANHVNPNNPRH